MSSLFNSIEAQQTTATANGALAHVSTASKLLNFFNSGASFRKQTETQNFIDTVLQAWNEDKLKCLKLMFYFRDIRGGAIGQGERDVFKGAYKLLLSRFNKDELLIRNIKFIPTYGRWDDMTFLIGASPEADKEIYHLILTQLTNDINNANSGNESEVSLLAKWLPSENTSSKATRTLAKNVRENTIKCSSRMYRNILSKLRKIIGIIENNLRNKEYSFSYSKQPSKAMMKYRKAFYRNDEERYKSYLESVLKGEAKMNMSTTYPHEIVSKYAEYKASGTRDITEIDSSLEAAWKSMVSQNIKNNFLVLADHSFSMNCVLNGSKSVSCMDVSTAMAIYIAENNKEGVFHNQFISFSNTPKLIDLSAFSTLMDKVNHVRKYDTLSTNIVAVFKLILNTATVHSLPQEDLPEAIIIISDMEFDGNSDFNMSDKTTINGIKEMFEQAEYKMPKIIFWNCAQKVNHHAANRYDGDVILLNGYKPGMFEMIMEGCNPEHFMNLVINNERYDLIN